MPELQNILSGLNGQMKIDDMELSASYVPTEPQDVMTKSAHESSLTTEINAAITANNDHDVDGGTF